MIDFLEMFLAVPIHVMVRFGRWTDILCEPLPPGAMVSPHFQFQYINILVNTWYYWCGVAG